MTAKLVKLVVLAGVVGPSASCGDFVRQGRSPVQLVVEALAGGSGQGTVLSDVADTTTDPCSPTSPCIFNDVAKARLRIQLKDPGSLGVAATPSRINEVTLDRYRVAYLRADNHNVQGVDVPYSFDSGLTITVPEGGAEVSFEVVRHSAKEEAPLRALLQSRERISTIATITFYGHDQAGNQVGVASTMGVDFGDFADKAR